MRRRVIRPYPRSCMASYRNLTSHSKPARGFVRQSAAAEKALRFDEGLAEGCLFFRAIAASHVGHGILLPSF